MSIDATSANDDDARTVTSFCRICEALCGVLVDVQGGRIVAVRGDPDHVSSRGFLCPKGAAMPRVVNDPDRVLHPMEKQADGTFREVTWDHALDSIGQRLAHVIHEHGGGAVGCYSGNPLGFGPASHMWSKKLLDGVGSQHSYSASTQDGTSRFVANFYLFGSPVAQLIPDLPHTSFLLCFGANPLVTNGSLVTIGRIKDELRAIVERGGRVTVVDPACTATAKAYEHVPIVPGTDAWLLAAMLHTILSEGLTDPIASEQADGIETLRSALAPFTPEVAADRTQISASDIAQLARDFAAAPAAAAYGRIGLCRGRLPTLTNFLLDALNVLTGNFDRRGGAIFGEGLVDWGDLMARMGRNTLGSHRTRVGGLPEVAGRRANVIAEEINTPGDGQIHALFMIAGNPVSSTPAGHLLAKSFAELDLLVSMDLYINESSRHADYILPSATFFERPDVILAFGGNMPSPWAQYTEEVVPPLGEAREEWWIVNQILERVGAPNPGDPWDTIEALIRDSPVAQRNGWTLPWVAEHEHGVALGGPPQVGAAAQRISSFTSGRTSKVQLAPPDVIAQLVGLAGLPECPDGELLLVGRRETRSMNSWMHNVRSARAHDAPMLFMNTADAASRGIRAGDPVELRTSIGAVQVAVQPTDEIISGTVSYPHGWGHEGGWRRAVEVGGVNINEIIPNEVQTKDSLSGMSFMDGVPVAVVPLIAAVDISVAPTSKETA
jgi:anaerobic selenocysteine-containing dehydrogenase